MERWKEDGTSIVWECSGQNYFIDGINIGINIDGISTNEHRLVTGVWFPGFFAGHLNSGLKPWQRR